MDRIYVDRLAAFESLLTSQENTPFLAWAKVVVNVCLKMQFDDMIFARNLTNHPYILFNDIILNSINHFKMLLSISDIGIDEKFNEASSLAKEELHQDLFNEMWSKYSKKEFRQYIDRYVYRIKVNDLNALVKGKHCVDMGCGNGVFCFAALECGASQVAGVDFGENSIAFAKAYAAQNKMSDQTDFRCTTVYDTGYADNSFHFAINNGVYHHLEYPDRAILETKRILIKNGWFWYYTEGEGALAYELGDVQIRVLKEIPAPFIEDVMVSMKISRNKIVHMMDAFNAIYAHTSWEKITRQLADHGFSNFRRLTGGMPTDFDLDVIEADPYGREKFGEGDLRILCQLLEK